jgi:enamine deaminase RidA (YjgF/YER057c/UK114 family)
MRKEVKGFGMPWEEEYGYAQAVKVDDTIYVSGQLSHDAEGNMVGAAPPDMETQMRQTYANAKKILAKFGATLDDVVEEVLYVTDMDKAFAAGAQGSLRVRKACSGEHDSRNVPARAGRAADRDQVRRQDQALA